MVGLAFSCVSDSKNDPSVRFLEYDSLLDVARKKKKIIQRDLFRLGSKFDALKDNYYKYKECLLEDERRLVVEGIFSIRIKMLSFFVKDCACLGTHEELSRHMDEIQATHDGRLRNAHSRFDMAKSAILAEMDYEKTAAQNMFLVHLTIF
jgi:hypothetical protein